MEGEATVNELATPFPMSAQAVGKHLRVLERAGLIERRRTAQLRPSRLRAVALKDAAEWLDSYREFWEAGFDRMDSGCETMAEPEPFGTSGFTTTRVFAAPRERVWQEWTEPERFADWFGGDGVRGAARDVAMDVRPGGAWRATMFCGPGRREIRWTGEYREVAAPERLVFTISDQPGDDRYELVTVVLTDLGDGRTEMRFEQRGHLRRRVRPRQQGWGAFFARIDERLAGLGDGQVGSVRPRGDE